MKKGMTVGTKINQVANDEWRVANCGLADWLIA